VRQTALRTRGESRLTRGVYYGVAFVAVLVAVAGIGMWIRDQRAVAAVPVRTAALGGLTATTAQAGWVSMEDHDMGDKDGYQMPAQMMPGAPEGDDMRLGVKLTLTNTGNEVRRFDLAAEFSLGGGRTGGSRPPHSDTFGGLPRLAPGSRVDGVLYFDTKVPGSSDPPLYLTWQRDHGEQRLVIDLGGAKTPDHHQHGS
jgi:hypothetical protein